MDIQRLRNLTTGRLHTEIGHVYQDLETITGEKGLMTHILPRALRSAEPWLREHVTDPRFWDGEYDTTHTGEIELPESSAESREEIAGNESGVNAERADGIAIAALAFENRTTNDLRRTEQPMTYEEQNQLWDELIDAREELLRIKHISQEALDGLSTIANLSEPHINRIRLQLRHKEDKLVFDATLVAYKQVQQRVALIVEELEDDE